MRGRRGVGVVLRLFLSKVIADDSYLPVPGGIIVDLRAIYCVYMGDDVHG